MSTWAGTDLGRRIVGYDERDAILYALAVGARATDLDLVFEERLRVLPSFALTLAQWAPDELGRLGAFDVATAVHGAQRLWARAPLPRAGKLELTARVGEVWDKGAAAVFDVVVEGEHFEATWSIFAPGHGGFGGERGPATTPPPDGDPAYSLPLQTSPDQAALYRLSGDRHHMHLDPAAALAAGQPRPFLHGLCTLAAATLPLAQAAGAHPAELSHLEGRFSAPVFPGGRLDVRAWPVADGFAFDVAGPGRPAITAGRADFDLR